jgi:hypothetical protein
MRITKTYRNPHSDGWGSFIQKLLDVGAVRVSVDRRTKEYYGDSTHPNASYWEVTAEFEVDEES